MGVRMTEASVLKGIDRWPLFSGFLGLAALLGILAATWLVARFTRATLAPDLHWRDIAAVGMLAGIGFTVSLLIGELAFGADDPHTEHLKVAILLASTTAAVLGGAALAVRDRQHRSRQQELGTR